MRMLRSYMSSFEVTLKRLAKMMVQMTFNNLITNWRVNIARFAVTVVLMTAATRALGRTLWDLKQLSVPPQVFAAPGFDEEGVRPLFFQGMPWHGRPTHVFAWYGSPAHGGPVRLPAVVLVHGGGGTAFANWVKLWNSRGYAAIAIDTCGSVPVSAGNNTWKRNPGGGPPCWDASFDQLDWPKSDQWTYQAVSDIILANSLLRSFPEVDPHRVGITGISWGAYLTTIVASIDSRFRFAVPVYGCGFLGEDSYWLPKFKEIGEVKAQEWLGLWDPSVYLRRARMPFLWVDGTNDQFYPLDSLRKSYLLPRGMRFLSIHLRMPHNHEEGEKPEEIRAFADQILQSGTPLAAVRSAIRKGQSVSVSYRSEMPIRSAELNYTTDNGAWRKRQWNTIIAKPDLLKHKATATLPKKCTAYFFNLVDQRGLIVSSELQIPTNLPHR